MDSRARWPLYVFVVAGLTCATPAIAEQVLLADFEASSSLSHWSFSNGPEFPGATGSLTVVNGNDGKASRLSYDLSAGGNYVSATFDFPQALNTKSIAFWVREPARSQAKLRLYDSQDQVFEYSIPRPLEAFAPDMWFRSVVDVQEFTGSFGGLSDGVLRMPLKGLSILAIPEFETVGASKGSIDFDDISSLDEYRVQLTPDTLPLIPAPTGAAELAPRLAVSIHREDTERALDLANAAGFSAVRVDLGWSDVETVPGVYDFSRFDSLLDALSARDLRLHLILDYLNPLYPELGASDFEQTTIPAFAAAVRQTVRHFRGRQVSYEIWNEPNSSTFWTRTPSEFAVLSAQLAAAVHSADPDALVCTGGLSGFDYRFAQAFLSVGGAEGVDAIGVHPYRKGGGESVGHDLLLMRAVVEDAHGTSLPIWDTEWGYSSSWYGEGHSAEARARQANMVARELLSAWAMGFPLVVYYDLRDGGTDPDDSEDNFGLVQNDYAEKPSMLAVRTLTQVASSRRYTGLLQTRLSGLHALRLDGRVDTVLAVWWDNPNRPVTLGLPGDARVRDLLGRSVTVDATEQASLTLSEDDGPIYVTLGTQTGSGGATATATRASATTSSGGARTTGLGGAASKRSSASTTQTTRTNTGGAAGTSAGGAVDVSNGEDDADTHVGCSCGTAPSRPLTAFPAILAVLATACARRRR